MKWISGAVVLFLCSVIPIDTWGGKEREGLEQEAKGNGFKM
jgi:hypothetical protein